MPESLGAGERESIAICIERGWAFLTNDRRARNFCSQAGVEAYDLPGLLRALWESRISSKAAVRKLADAMEAGEGIVLRNKEAIFRK